jgi:hypothetical protein
MRSRCVKKNLCLKLIHFNEERGNKNAAFFLTSVYVDLIQNIASVAENRYFCTIATSYDAVVEGHATASGMAVGFEEFEFQHG